MSVNYCQLSSPGYKEEQLRREEVRLDLFSTNMEEFTFASYSSSSAGNYYRRDLHSSYGAQNVRYYDMTNIQFEPTTSANFDVTDRYLKAKETGLYAFYSEYVELLVSSKWISQNDNQYNMASLAMVKKGQMIHFKIANDRNAMGTTLTIYKLK